MRVVRKYNINQSTPHPAAWPKPTPPPRRVAVDHGLHAHAKRNNKTYTKRDLSDTRYTFAQRC